MCETDYGLLSASVLDDGSAALVRFQTYQVRDIKSDCARYRLYTRRTPAVIVPSITPVKFKMSGVVRARVCGCLLGSARASGPLGNLMM